MTDRYARQVPRSPCTKNEIKERKKAGRIVTDIYQTAGGREIPKESENCTIPAGGMYMETVRRKGMHIGVCRRGNVGESHSFFETNSETEVARGRRSAAISLWREIRVSNW